MPSRAEPFGLVAWEAIALGTPVIVGEESGVAHLLLERRLKSPQDFAFEHYTLPVDESSANLQKTWIPALVARLSNIKNALADAERIRACLSLHITWDHSVAVLLARIAEL
jgi:hypothetical protein